MKGKGSVQRGVAPTTLHPLSLSLPLSFSFRSPLSRYVLVLFYSFRCLVNGLACCSTRRQRQQFLFMCRKHFHHMRGAPIDTHTPAFPLPSLYLPPPLCVTAPADGIKFYLSHSKKWAPKSMQRFAASQPASCQRSLAYPVSHPPSPFFRFCHQPLPTLLAFAVHIPHFDKLRLWPCKCSANCS